MSGCQERRVGEGEYKRVVGKEGSDAVPLPSEGAAWTFSSSLAFWGAKRTAVSRILTHTPSASTLEV